MQKSEITARLRQLKLSYSFLLAKSLIFTINELPFSYPHNLIHSLCHDFIDVFFSWKKSAFYTLAACVTCVHVRLFCEWWAASGLRRNKSKCISMYLCTCVCTCLRYDNNNCDVIFNLSQVFVMSCRLSLSFHLSECEWLWKQKQKCKQRRRSPYHIKPLQRIIVFFTITITSHHHHHNNQSNEKQKKKRISKRN